jgi:hypothetical protein
MKCETKPATVTSYIYCSTTTFHTANYYITALYLHHTHTTQTQTQTQHNFLKTMHALQILCKKNFEILYNTNALYNANIHTVHSNLKHNFNVI